MSLTRSSLTCSCIFSELLNILHLTTHDLRNTRDNRMKGHAPQPIGFAVLTLTCTSAGCCFHRARRSSPPACSRRFEMRSMEIKRRPRFTTLLGSVPLRLACLEYVGRLSVADLDSTGTRRPLNEKKIGSGKIRVNRSPPLSAPPTAFRRRWSSRSGNYCVR